MNALRTGRHNFVQAKIWQASWHWLKFSSALLPHRIIDTARSAAQREISASTQVRKAYPSRLKPNCALRASQSGFTLVELLVTMIIMSIVAIALSGFVANWLQAASISQARADLLANAESALDTINTDIRLSGSADLHNRWADANAPGADAYSWTSDGDTIVLAKAAQDASRNIIFADPSKYISQKYNVIYYLAGQKLYRRTITSDDSNDAAITTCPPPGVSGCPADKTVATDVTAFSVKYFDADNTEVAPEDARSIQLAITMSDTVGSKTISASYDTRMVFRNE